MKKPRNQLLAVVMVLLVFGLLCTQSDAACLTRTGSTHVLVSRTAQLPLGTVIQALTPNGVCAGEIVFTGEPLALVLWGQDPSGLPQSQA